MSVRRDQSYDIQEIDAWEEPNGMRYRLVERGQSFRLEAWELYRWVAVEAGLQIVARRVAELRSSPVPVLIDLKHRRSA